MITKKDIMCTESKYGEVIEMIYSYEGYSDLYRAELSRNMGTAKVSKWTDANGWCFLFGGENPKETGIGLWLTATDKFHEVMNGEKQ